MNARWRGWALALAGMLGAVSSRANIAFNFIPEAGTPQNVIDGFSAAGAKWTAVLQDNITVNLVIGFPALPAGVLGQTTSSYVQQDYAAVVAALNASATSPDDFSAYAHLQSGPTYSRLINHTTDNPNGANSATPYVNSLTPVAMTRANAKALGFLAAGPDPDATIHLNSNAPFDFDPSNGTTSGQYDFVTIADHEIGHALGFESVVNDVEQLGTSADQLPAKILDLFRFSSDSLAAGAGFIDTTADTRNKWFSVNGGANSVAPFATGAVYGSGYQADHWKEFSFTGLMDPQSFTGLQRRIGPTDQRAFDVIGYRLPEPSAGALLGVGLVLHGALRRRRPGR